MGPPIINPWGAHQQFFLVQRYAQINQLNFKKVANKYKENKIIVIL